MRDQRASTEVVTRLKELGINRRVSLDDMEDIVAAALVEPRAEIKQLREAVTGLLREDVSESDRATDVAFARRVLAGEVTPEEDS